MTLSVLAERNHLALNESDLYFEIQGNKQMVSELL